nr:MAG TPA: Golgin subfamily A member 5 [Caudoviricetes sp.]
MKKSPALVYYECRNVRDSTYFMCLHTVVLIAVFSMFPAINP